MTDKKDIINRTINPKITLRDGTFGLSLDFKELIKEPLYITRILVKVKDEEDIVVKQFYLLPHQLYLHDLKDLSCDGRYDVFVALHLKSKIENYVALKVPQSLIID